MKSLDDLLAEGVAGRRVLVRADLNVPLDGQRITDDGRIRAVLPTITALRDAGAKVIVFSHLGRPKGAPDPKYSLEPVAQRLDELLGAPVAFAADTVGPQAQEIVASVADGGVVLLENLRFNAGETSKDDAERKAFATQLSHFAGQNGAYVDDAFGAVHRKHASVHDLAELLPAYAGGLVRRELEVLRTLTGTPERPYVVVLGGSKVSDKLGVIDALLPKVDTLLIGGGMCFTFLAAQGHGVGDSLLEQEMIDTCKRLLSEGGDKIVLPTDVVLADDFSADANTKVVAADKLEDGWKGLDIGPASVELFASKLAGAKTVFWNGPMGVFELAPFAAGTKGVAEAVASVDGLTIVGGGDSAAAVRQLGIDEARFGHISTGGGASLEFLEGKELPGVAVLERA
ncbi:phosphoglycerate kinase [Cryptosporangium arvum]|uniref:Phosphoglycerate kinase n=1 Tax=Cryptosporangium arvum DSM 44712 TaxID=927661 RepID=A0A010ZUN3_9ACTN|nr:phosphoglycerate kinase [Cryptosporangium arvum]EXG80912.1 3-phosphoglycerate kinase [Cryptosporangium arvum DSM 44712]